MVVPLTPSYEFNTSEVMDYITQILQQFNLQGAYGILAAVERGEGDFAPTIVFGIPGRKLLNSDLPPPPNNLGLLIQDNRILPVAGPDTPWATQKVKHINQLTLEPCSVGLQG